MWAQPTHVPWVFTALKKHAFEGYVGIDIGRVEGKFEDLNGLYRRALAFLQDLSERIGL